MAQFQRGKPMAAAALNTVAATAWQGANVKGGGLDVQSGPGGNTVSAFPLDESDPNTIRAQYVGAATVPLFGVVEIHNSWSRVGGHIVGRCRIPSQSGFARLGVAQQGMGSGKIAPVQNKGNGYVMFDIASVPAAMVGESRYRLGGKKNSFLAQYDQLGPFLVLEDLGVVWTGTRLAIVEFTASRGDNKMLDSSYNTADDGPYRTYVWGAGYTVSETSPGEVTIELT